MYLYLLYRSQDGSDENKNSEEIKYKIGVNLNALNIQIKSTINSTKVYPYFA